MVLAAKLTELIRAPCVEVTGGGQGHGVLTAGRDLNYESLNVGYLEGVTLAEVVAVAKLAYLTPAPGVDFALL